MAAQGQGQPQGHFDQFISLMNHEQAKDLVRNINLFMKSFKQSAPDADTDSRAVQGFLQQMETAMAKHPLFADTTPQEQDAATEALEKYLMTKLHERTFRQGSDDVERDEFLAVRCAALQFVRPEHLEIPAGVVDSDHLGRAVEELNKINKYKAPRDKLVCVLNCCSMINAQLAKNSKAEGIGADDFTPMLIYVVIKARTSFLASNLAYIERYRYHPKLTAEAQYYYIQLCGAATFIEMINAQSLKVDRDEFIAHMLAAGAMTDEQLASLQSNKSADMAAAAAVVSGPAAAAVGSGSGSGTQQSIHQSTQAAVAAATAAGIRPNDWQFTAQQQQQQFPLQMQALPTVNSPAGGWPQTAAGHSHTGLACQQQQQQYSQPLQQQQQQQLLLLPRITDLESQGAALLSQRDPAASARQLVSRHPFCCSNLDSLSLGDVGQLLSAYKELVLRYEALTAALEDFSQQQQQQQQQGTASAAAAAGPLPPAASAAGVAGDALTPPASTGGAGEAVMLPPLSPGSAAEAAPQPTMSPAPAAAAAEQQEQQDPTLPADSSRSVALQQPADTANNTAADPTTTATGSSQTAAAEAVAVLTTPAAASAAVLSPPPPPPAIAEAAAGAGAEATPAAGAANREPSLAPIRSSSNASAASAQAAVLAAAAGNATELAVSSLDAQQQQQQQQSNVDDLLHSLLSPSAAAGGAPAGVPANTTEAIAAFEQQQQQQPQQATAVEDEDLFGIFQRPSPAGGSATNDSTAAAAAPSLLD